MIIITGIIDPIELTVLLHALSTSGLKPRIISFASKASICINRVIITPDMMPITKRRTYSNSKLWVMRKIKEEKETNTKPKMSVIIKAKRAGIIIAKFLMKLSKAI